MLEGGVMVGPPGFSGSPGFGPRGSFSIASSTGESTEPVEREDNKVV